MSKNEKRLLCALGIIIVLCIIGGGIAYSFAPPHLAEISSENEFPAGLVNSINIDSITADIRLNRGGSNFTVKVSGMTLINAGFASSVSVEVSSGVLNITEQKNALFVLGGGENVVIAVTVPDSYDGAINIAGISSWSSSSEDEIDSLFGQVNLIYPADRGTGNWIQTLRYFATGK